MICIKPTYTNSDCQLFKIFQIVHALYHPTAVTPAPACYVFGTPGKFRILFFVFRAVYTVCMAMRRSMRTHALIYPTCLTANKNIKNVTGYEHKNTTKSTLLFNLSLSFPHFAFAFTNINVTLQKVMGFSAIGHKEVLHDGPRRRNDAWPSQVV